MSNGAVVKNHTETRDPIFGCMDNWYLHLKGNLDGGLESMLHPDVVFL